MIQAQTKLFEALSRVENLIDAGRSAGIYVVGLGIREFAEATLECLFILSRADKIFVLAEDETALELVLSINSSSVDLYRYYEPGKSQVQVYEEIANYIVSNYDNNRIVFATYGNPFFLNDISTNIYNRAVMLSIPVYAYSALSSLDAILNILLIEVQEDGLQCYLAGHLVHKRPNVDTTIPLLIFQLGSIEERTIDLGGSLSANVMGRLKDYLHGMYSKEELWAFVNCSPSFLGEHRIVIDKLQNLESIAPIARKGTLVVGTKAVSRAFRE